jgi:DNA-binding CsgD family transcriptional regulator
MGAEPLQKYIAGQHDRAVAQMESFGFQRSCVAPQLTSQERKVLQMLCQYDRLQQVAEALFVQPDTVRKHLRHIYRKLGVHSLHRAILRALALGLIEPPAEPSDDATTP